MMSSRIHCSLVLQSENKTNKTENMKLDLARELKTDAEQEAYVDNNCSSCAWDGPQRLGKEARRIGNQRTNRDHPDHSIFRFRFLCLMAYQPLYVI